jgi:hypothetical protein
MTASGRLGFTLYVSASADSTISDQGFDYDPRTQKV